MSDARYTREQRISAATRIISEYERQTGVPMGESAIGRILANSERDPFPALIEHAQACARRLEFCAEVDATVAGTKPHWMHVTAARTTPAALREVGLPNLPIFHTQKHVHHELAPKNPANGHMHGLSQEGARASGIARRRMG